MSGEIFLLGGGKEHNDPEIGGRFFKGIKKVLYIPLAWPTDDFQSCLKWFKEVTEKFGEIEIKMLENIKENIKLEDYDGIFIGGGNTFKLLKKLREGKIIEKLKKYYKNGGKILGGSAGAIIFGKDINIALICKDKDTNLVGLKDTNGINLVQDFYIQCHFEENQIKEHKNFIGNSDKKIICIPEGSGLIIKNKEYEVIGNSPVYEITKEKTLRHLPGKIKI